MGIKVLAGEGYNILETGTVTVSSEDADFGDENLVDGRSDLLFKFAAAGTSDTVTVDGNRLLNGELDTWSATDQPDNWIAVGTVAESTAIARNGSAAAISGPSSSAGISSLSQDFEARAGEPIVLETYTALSAASTAPFAVSPVLTLQNLFTGKFATSSGGWSLGLAAWATVANTTSFSQSLLAIETEDFDTVGRDSSMFRLSCTVAGATSGIAYLDDTYVWSSVNHASVHGWNIRGDVIPKLESSPDNFASASTSSTILQANMTKAQPAFYTALTTPVADRYWRIKFSYSAASTIFGTAPTEAIHLGEVVIGYAQELDRGFNYGSQITELAETLVARTATGAPVQTFKIAQHPRRVVDLEFDYFTEAEMLNGREQWRRASGNSSPVVVVPDTCEDVVILGHLEPVFSVSRSLTEHYTGSQVRVTELPFAVVTT